MHQSPMRASLALPLFVISIGCAPNNPGLETKIVQLPPEIRTVYQHAVVPEQSLICAIEPRVPNAKTDLDLALWTEEVRQSGTDCRTKLQAVRELLAIWGSDG
jgi:hypothetical protein